MIKNWLLGIIFFSWHINHIPENPNPKSGIIPGSYSFESVLSAVADFKAPVFEPGGSMQQGMYTPKGTFIYFKILFQNWFSEYKLYTLKGKCFAFYVFSFEFLWYIVIMLPFIYKSMVLCYSKLS